MSIYYMYIVNLQMVFNPRTVFWGPFGPRRPKTRYIFVIGQAYLLLIFVILYHSEGFQNPT